MKPGAPRTVRAGIALTVAAVAALLSGCSDQSAGPASGAASVAITPKSATLAGGGTVRLSATIRDANGTPLTGHAITWTSDNPAVATVDATGLVTGVAVGLSLVQVIACPVSGLPFASRIVADSC